MSLGDKQYDSALREHVQDWIGKIKNVDILVGVPTFNNEDSIGHVIASVGEGLQTFYPDLKKAIFISDGGSLDDTRENAYAASIPDNVERRVTIYRGLPGKGTSFRAVFECANELSARAVLVFDSDLRSITPYWVKQMADPILEDKFDFCTPYYRRHPFDGTITNMIVYPLISALFGRNIRQPIGGDFSFSTKLSHFWSDQSVWLTDVARFGIDIWMTLSAINENFRLAQVDLGTKIHNPKDPAADLGPMFFQVISTLFYLIGIYENNWRQNQNIVDVPILSDHHGTENLDLPDMDVSVQKMNREFEEGFSHFKPLYRQVMDVSTFDELDETVHKLEESGTCECDDELWAKILYDFVFTYQNWSRNRRRLVDIMTPLYFGRTVNFVESVNHLSWEEAEKIILRQVSALQKLRSYFVNKFELWE